MEVTPSDSPAGWKCWHLRASSVTPHSRQYFITTHTVRRDRYRHRNPPSFKKRYNSEMERKNFKLVLSSLDKFLKHKLATCLSRQHRSAHTRHLHHHNNELCNPVSIHPKMILVCPSSLWSSYVSFSFHRNASWDFRSHSGKNEDDNVAWRRVVLLKYADVSEMFTATMISTHLGIQGNYIAEGYKYSECQSSLFFSNVFCNLVGVFMKLRAK
jgi:hypothetical protein